jgi:23S rRNA (cytosine1962-C5)-methyltransferase
VSSVPPLSESETAMKTVHLKAGKDAPIKRRSPFIFSGAINTTDEGIEDGDIVAVLDAKGRHVASGHYQAGGSIRVRVLSFGAGAIDDTFWQDAVADAWRLRQQIGLAHCTDTNAFRLIHGEGDGLPGLIIDNYDGHLVLEPHSSGMRISIPAIEKALQSVLGKRLKALYVKGAHDAPTAANPSSAEIVEHGLRFLVDWTRGQKTGFFLDQRENRKHLIPFARDHRILNLFSYSGGFSVYALHGGAQFVCSVDGSALALAWASENVSRNGFDAQRHEIVEADVFDYLRNSPDKWDVVVCDPPAFAKHMSARHEAIQAYRRLNAQALRHVKPGGILFSFSCSQVVDQGLFRGAVLAAAIDEGRPVRILATLHQPADHPVSIYHPEGEYLKGLILQAG